VTADSRIVDARGMLCPWPVIRLSRAAREMGNGHLRILADDPAAPREIALFCREKGWSCSEHRLEKDAFDIVIG
jgi:tRNA 2-thiouridine synthesizing protein A